jgi:hypothetical protein
MANKNTKKVQISEERKMMYYGGMALVAIGLILFMSNFLLPFTGGMDPFTGEESIGGMAFRSIGGMVLIMIGNGLMAVGKKGAAGAGLILDPDQARKDVEPWSKMAGGVINDVASEIDLSEVLSKGKGTTHEQVKEIIKIKCQNCSALNDEDAKFCKSCGAQM